MIQAIIALSCILFPALVHDDIRISPEKGPHDVAEVIANFVVNPMDI